MTRQKQKRKKLTKNRSCAKCTNVGAFILQGNRSKKKKEILDKYYFLVYNINTR